MYKEPNKPRLTRHVSAMKQRVRNRVIDWRARKAGNRQAPSNAEADYQAVRARALSALVSYSDTHMRQSEDGHRYNNVLLDGMWENPNFWTRFAFFRTATGLEKAELTGLLGPYNRIPARTAFETFGAAQCADYHQLCRQTPNQRKIARRLLRNVKTPDDLLKLELPHDFLPEIVYDGLLKRQRRGEVDISDPLLVDYLCEALVCLEAAHQLFSRNSFDLVLLSHALNFDFGALSWCALQAGADIVLLYGDFGMTRFNKIRTRDDLLNYLNCPTPEEVSGQPDDERARRIEAGGQYLETRLKGSSGDISAIYAYERRQEEVQREDIAAAFGWDPAKPIVCVFASNWFDFPHSSNMNNFRDFREWIDETLVVAGNTEDINWLFKPHPCDTWYGAVNGPTVADLVSGFDRPNVKLVNDQWNGHALMKAIDAGITYFGTIGIEMPSIGKPVMVADQAWYAPHNFVHVPESREDYLATLSTRWWEGHDAEGNAQRAREFIGWFFCDPEWADGYRFHDDSEQHVIYRDLPEFIQDNERAIDCEISMITSWMESDHLFFHTHKMIHSRVATKHEERSAVDIRHKTSDDNAEVREAS